MNHKGTMIATASTKGTLIRIWDAAKRLMLAELRRGTDQALLYCINFSPRDEWICCSSDKGPSIKYVRAEGEGGGYPKAYVVREVA